MYRVVAVYESEPEYIFGFYETQAEAEQVASRVFEEYSDEVSHVEVRDRWQEVVSQVG